MNETHPRTTSDSRHKLLVVGVGPLAPERPDHLFAPGIRTWGMARELARAGHHVRLLCADFGAEGMTIARRYDLKWERGEEPHLPEPEVLRLPGAGWAELIAIEAASFKARAAFGTTDVMNHALAESGIMIPIWMDFNGDPMAERQMLAQRHGSDEGLLDQWTLMAPALARADRLSGCSPDQCAALLGQLGAVGRLNRFTAFERLVKCVPVWVELIPIDIDSEPAVRGTRTPEDAFIIVQTGGFNTWLDVETLFAALEQAMAANPRIHFAATGGAIPGHHESSFAWFAERVEKSPYRERFHLLGWLPLGMVPRVLAEADLGLNVDLPCVEGILGARNRLLTWIMGGVTVVSTPGCDLAREFEDAGVMTAIPHGDAAAVTRAILAVEATPAAKRKAAAEAAQKWARREHAADVCLQPMLDWAAAPKPASDLQAWMAGTAEPPSLLLQMQHGAAAVREARRKAQRLDWLERRLATLEGSRLVRMALKLRGADDLEAERPPEEL